MIFPTSAVDKAQLDVLGTLHWVSAHVAKNGIVQTVNGKDTNSVTRLSSNLGNVNNRGEVHCVNANWKDTHHVNVCCLQYALGLCLNRLK